MAAYRVEIPLAEALQHLMVSFAILQCPRVRQVRLRFRLQTLLILWTVILLPLGFIGYVRDQRSRERRAVQELTRGRIVEYVTNAPKQSTLDKILLGDKSYKHISLVAGWFPMDGRPGLRDDQKTFSPSELKALRYLPSLKELYLHRSNVTDDELKYISPLNTLELLSLDGCRITDNGLDQLSQLHEMKALYLRDTPISDQGVCTMKSFPRLEVLDLEGTQVTDACLIHLTNLGKLKALYLSETRITGDHFEPLAGLQRLKEIELARTRFNGKGLRYLKQLNSLEYLDMEDTQVTDAYVAELLGHPRLHTCVVSGALVSKEMTARLVSSTDDALSKSDAAGQ
jgi:hypothetical protein